MLIDLRNSWVPMPAEVDRLIADQPTRFQSFSSCASDLADTTSKDVYFWKAEIALFGKTLPAFHQTRGTCVSQGHGRFAQDQLIIDIIIRTASEEYKYGVATEPIYVGSRVEIGKNQLGRGEGSCGIWAMEWLKNYGVLFRTKYGTIDLSTPDDNVACSWTAVPADLEIQAKQRPIENFTPISSSEQAKLSIQNYYGVTVCSNQGFRNQRSKGGFDYPQGSWSHCMYARGWFNTKGNVEAFAVQQSWGNQPTGPSTVYLESGEEVELPEGVFLVESSVFDRMLKAGDSFTGSGVKGFEKRTIDWSV